MRCAEIVKFADFNENPGNKLDSLIIGNNIQMLNVMNILNRVKDLNTIVLITGESGTGKSLLAKTLHDMGQNRNQPFIHINCAGIPANLMESELFGYERGAFTGAHITKPGKFELAGKGTIFLDEICSLPLELQAKLLTVLEERRVERLGSTKSYDVRARIIAASNNDLENLVKQKKFREDLYYRLNVIQIHLPPLRYHKNDIEILVDHFVRKYEYKFNKSDHKVSSEVWGLLKTYNWPGNIRELENVIERAVALSVNSEITLDEICEKIKRQDQPEDDLPDVPPDKLYERDMIIEALRKYFGNRSKTAEYLGISKRKLQYKLKELKINV